LKKIDRKEWVYYNLSVIEKDLRRLIHLSSIGWVMAVCPVIGLLIGWGLDKVLKTAPWLTIVFVIIGIIAGFYEGIRMVIKGSKE
jgi:ATP synthase protein I